VLGDGEDGAPGGAGAGGEGEADPLYDRPSKSSSRTAARRSRLCSGICGSVITGQHGCLSKWKIRGSFRPMSSNGNREILTPAREAE